MHLSTRKCHAGHLARPFLSEVSDQRARRLHATESFVLCTQKWLHGLEEEFFAQGDFEAELGLPITPFMDRALPGISSKQVKALRPFS